MWRVCAYTIYSLHASHYVKLVSSVKTHCEFCTSMPCAVTPTGCCAPVCCAPRVCCTSTPTVCCELCSVCPACPSPATDFTSDVQHLSQCHFRLGRILARDAEGGTEESLKEYIRAVQLGACRTALPCHIVAYNIGHVKLILVFPFNEIQWIPHRKFGLILAIYPQVGNLTQLCFVLCSILLRGKHPYRIGFTSPI